MVPSKRRMGVIIMTRELLRVQIILSAKIFAITQKILVLRERSFFEENIDKFIVKFANLHHGYIERINFCTCMYRVYKEEFLYLPGDCPIPPVYMLYIPESGEPGSDIFEFHDSVIARFYPKKDVGHRSGSPYGLRSHHNPRFMGAHIATDVSETPCPLLAGWSSRRCKIKLCVKNDMGYLTVKSEKIFSDLIKFNCRPKKSFSKNRFDNEVARQDMDTLEDSLKANVDRLG